MINLKELEKEVKQLIIEENWPKAYKICNQILELDNENSTFIKLKNRIEKEVKNSNKKLIIKELKKLENLLDQENYEEYLKQIAPLQSYASDFPEIERQIIKAKKALEKQYQDRQKNAFQEIENEINQKKEDLDFQTIIQKLELLQRINYDTKRVDLLLKKVKTIWINKQLKENQGLINSQKYEDIIIFLLKLKRVDDQNSRINNLIQKTKNSYQDFKIESKKDFIFKTTEEIKTLIIKKSYDKAIELSERVLFIDSKNPVVNNLYKKAIKLARKNSEKIIYQQILENSNNLKNLKFNEYISV